MSCCGCVEAPTSLSHWPPSGLRRAERHHLLPEPHPAPVRPANTAMLDRISTGSIHSMCGPLLLSGHSRATADECARGRRPGPYARAAQRADGDPARPTARGDRDTTSQKCGLRPSDSRPLPFAASQATRPKHAVRSATRPTSPGSCTAAQPVSLANRAS